MDMYINLNLSIYIECVLKNDEVLGTLGPKLIEETRPGFLSTKFPFENL